MKGLDRERIDGLESLLGHRFADHDLLRIALTHRSSAHQQGSDEQYERLEFLGDAVLGLIAAEWLYGRLPEAPEGDLARIKSYLVSAAAIAEHAREWRLGDLLIMSAGEERTGGREKESLLADVFEALLGALFVDGGIEPARQAIVPLLERDFERRDELSEKDPKTTLQEMLQADRRDLPQYVLASSQGPDHDRTFQVECLVEGKTVGRGEGRTKKEAERRAAASALARLSP